jgi:hypothetical protein
MAPPFLGARSDHDLAVDVTSALKGHGGADLLDGKGRSDGYGDVAQQDRVGDPIQGNGAGVAAPGCAYAARRVGPGRDL